MNDEYLFFYDESGHSRKITKETIDSDNFSENFVVSIIGYKKSKKDIIESEYIDLENKYRDYFQSSELKSTIFKKKKYKNGFATFKPKDVAFLIDLFDLIIRNDVYSYYFISNKIEWIVVQLLRDYFNNPIYNAVAIEYSLTKIISLYRPKEVIDAIYHKDNKILIYLKSFFTDLLIRHKNAEPKGIENKAISLMMAIIDNYNYKIDYNWDYNPSFNGLSIYLKEISISNYSLYVDEEGSGETIKAAKRINKKSQEINSKSSASIRLADMLCGIINNFLEALNDELSFNSNDDATKIKVLSKPWFKLTGDQFKCYKLFKKVFIDHFNTYNKIRSSRYQDMLLYFICILNYVDSFRNTNLLFDNINNAPYEMNAYVIDSMKEDFERQNIEQLFNKLNGI